MIALAVLEDPIAPYLKYSFAIVCFPFQYVKTGRTKSAPQTVVFYLEPLSYGMPSAFGALDFFEVKIRRIIVMIYGSIGYR